MVATSQDARFPTTVGSQAKKAGVVDKLMTGYMNQLIGKSANKPSLRIASIEIDHLLRSPFYLYHPAIMWQVLT